MASADSLPLPASVVSYFQGAIGVPPGGFPEPLTSKVRKGRSLPDGSAAYEGRPGATMPDYDFAEAKKELVEKYGEFAIDETEVLSHAMYPQVTEFPLPRTTRGAHAATHYTRQPSAPRPSSEPRPPPATPAAGVHRVPGGEEGVRRPRHPADQPLPQPDEGGPGGGAVLGGGVRFDAPRTGSRPPPHTSLLTPRFPPQPLVPHQDGVDLAAGLGGHARRRAHRQRRAVAVPHPRPQRRRVGHGPREGERREGQRGRADAGRRRRDEGRGRRHGRGGPGDAPLPLPPPPPPSPPPPPPPPPPSPPHPLHRSLCSRSWFCRR